MSSEARALRPCAPTRPLRSLGSQGSAVRRRRQLFDCYREDPKPSSLVRVLPSTHNLISPGQCKGAEERVFGFRTAVQQRWSKRELERQVCLKAFEQAVLTPPKRSPAFLAELGRDFCFIGSQLPVQVGGRDLALEMLLVHRGLSCLVATDLAAKPHEFYVLNAPGPSAAARTTVRRSARTA